jgi:hypothetical protein
VDRRDERGRVAEPPDRRVRAHAAGVRAGVAVADALVVLRRPERDGATAVAEREERGLATLEQLLDDDRPAQRRGRAQPVGELLLGSADEDALAGGETVGLHDARRPRLVERPRGRDAGSGHHLLREGLRALDARRVRARPEDRDAGIAEGVGEAGDEGRLRPDDHELGNERRCEPQQALAVVGAHRVARPERGDAGVSGGRVQLVERAAAREGPRERVLARARPDEEHVHGGEDNRPPAARLPPRRDGRSGKMRRSLGPGVAGRDFMPSATGRESCGTSAAAFSRSSTSSC